jgi:chemotaxis response regulator CheB
MKVRLGVVSSNHVQKNLIAELMGPVFGSVTQYDLSHVETGEFSKTGVHVLIVDFSDEAIADSSEVLEMLGRDDPYIVLNEAEIYPMSADARLGWRNKTVAAIQSLIPGVVLSTPEPAESSKKERLHDLWVLGSSSGGPQAVREFFVDLPVLPITIVLVQHIATAAFATYLERVKDATRGWKVLPATHGMQIDKGTIIVVPQDANVSIDKGHLELTPYIVQPSFNPSINATIRTLFKSTSGGLGVIILTGMGDDGAAAIKELQGRAISVFAQDSESCAARSMPESARETGAVKVTDTPRGLARELAQHYPPQQRG